jgi:hypothetical protein
MSVSEEQFNSELPPDVRNGGSVDKDLATADLNPHGSAGEGTQDPHASVRDDEQRTPSPHSYRFVVERGSGSSGTAYNKLDHEVIDVERKAGNRIVARATRRDATLICTALNLFGHIAQR